MNKTVAMLIIGGAVLAALAADAALEWAAGLSGGKAPWYAARASGVIAYVALALSTVWGLLTSSRLLMRWAPLPLASELHKTLTFVGLGALAAHGAVLLYDQHIPYGILDIALPFRSEYRPAPIGIGIISGYLMVLLTWSFYVRRPLGQKAWRALHYAGFAAFALSLGHGILSGTDSGTGWMQALYLVSGSAVLFLTLARVLGDRYVPARRQAHDGAVKPLSPVARAGPGNAAPQRPRPSAAVAVDGVAAQSGADTLR
jgi:hypothetical protein